MEYVDEFRDEAKAGIIAGRIRSLGLKNSINIMEVCGGHTITFLKFGLKDLLPDTVNMVSGPGCPVCVTSSSYIDIAIELAKKDGFVITTFGDMIRVPGSRSSLLKERALGRDIRICLSTDDALSLADSNPGKQFVFLGIGFETTAPTIASVIVQAESRGIENFSILCAVKTMPAALRALASSPLVNIQGLVCPGHVSAITGLGIYRFLPEEFNIPCVVTGFEPLDMLLSIEMLARRIVSGTSDVENEYTRAVKPEGNVTAQKLMNKVFEPVDAEWRGLGIIPGSGLGIKEAYSRFDVEKRFPVAVPETQEPRGCICGDIMRGIKTPESCRLFGSACTPENPVGACMVSAEGTCATYFKYGKSG
ncbi:MAG: hydrogenase formation protein HypD [Spirochaetales bacterium]|nr:hydrogenase formation protein HypD [Spirochaetales bacterium]